MGCVCSPAIDAEMADWKRLGGTNSGCCGDQRHSYGFHRAANTIPSSDYSRRHDSGKPVDMDWACAGDFAHNSKPALRAVHAGVLARLMKGELPMICEFIGQPWAGKPVYYWCRWAGNSTLKKYTGQGHDTWSHISWWRSKADQRSHMYASQAPAAAVTPADAPAYPGHVLEPSEDFSADLKVWQARMKVRGWDLDVDGYFGDQTTNVVKKFQQEKGLEVDGVIGPKTWAAAWSSPISG